MPSWQCGFTVAVVLVSAKVDESCVITPEEVSEI